MCLGRLNTEIGTGRAADVPAAPLWARYKSGNQKPKAPRRPLAVLRTALSTFNAAWSI
jgi:hypothetical protein